MVRERHRPHLVLDHPPAAARQGGLTSLAFRFDVVSGPSIARRDLVPTFHTVNED
jgi:hypothetical protein